MVTRDLTLIALFAAMTAVCAQISLTVPFFSSVPFTMQTFAVLASGAALGARRGFTSQVVYLLLGAAGVPVFARFHGGAQILVGPTAGYLLGFPLAALVTGWGWDTWGPVEGRRSMKPRYAMFAGLLCIYALGVAGLVATRTVPTIGQAVRVGVYPFFAMDLLKAILADYIATRVRAAVPVLQALARDR